MATVYTREWIKFFTGCGIPNDIAAMYALIFYENRIQKNMLLDLNKEYLRDMGITVMGDVIAILRHAKIIHEKYVRAQILSDDDCIVEETISVNESDPAVKKSTPMKRMLEHYTRKCNTQEIELVSNTQSFKKLIKKKEEFAVQRQLKKKIQITSREKNLKEKGLEVPIPKARRVLPENEGGYKIKMPLGTTERSKKLLEQAKKQKAKTVFDRLGESSVSSTTSEISTNSTSSSPQNREKPNNSSVFSRLGEKTSVVSSTSSIEDSETVLLDQLPYAGILKGASLKKNLSNTTMRADEQLEVNKEKKGVSVKKRLGISKPEEGAPQKRPAVKAVKHTGETLAKTAVHKLSSKFNSTQVEAKNSSGTLGLKNFNDHNTSEKQSNTLAIQTPKTKMLALKRKIDDDLDVSPLKKVRFGRTTHRLIPASPGSTDQVSFVRNYPKLTMIINNRVNASFETKIGSLNSDKVSDRLGVKARIGIKSLQGRLGRRMTPVQTSRDNKTSTVKDRSLKNIAQLYCCFNSWSSAVVPLPSSNEQSVTNISLPYTRFKLKIHILLIFSSSFQLLITVPRLL